MAAIGNSYSILLVVKPRVGIQKRGQEKTTEQAPLQVNIPCQLISKLYLRLSALPKATAIVIKTVLTCTVYSDMTNQLVILHSKFNPLNTSYSACGVKIDYS